MTSQQETSLVKIKLSLHNENEIWFDAQNLETLKITVKENVHNCDNIIDIKWVTKRFRKDHWNSTISWSKLTNIWVINQNE